MGDFVSFLSETKKRIDARYPGLPIQAASSLLRDAQEK